MLHKVVNHDPSLLALTKSLVDSHFIPKLVTRLLPIHLLIVDCFKTVVLQYSIVFSLLFCLCLNFFGIVLQPSKSKIVYVYTTQLIWPVANFYHIY